MGVAIVQTVLGDMASVPTPEEPQLVHSWSLPRTTIVPATDSEEDPASVPNAALCPHDLLGVYGYCPGRGSLALNPELVTVHASVQVRNAETCESGLDALPVHRPEVPADQWSESVVDAHSSLSICVSRTCRRSAARWSARLDQPSPALESGLAHTARFSSFDSRRVFFRVFFLVTFAISSTS